MRSRYAGSDRPSKAVSQRTVVSIVAVLVAVLVGLVTRSIPYFIGFFIIAWLITMGSIFLHHFKNATGEGEAVMEYEGAIETTTVAAIPRAERLRELQKLRDEGLISEEEHAERKAEILAEI